jgi:hypothetical protein
VIFDTDVFIWLERGHRVAASLVDDDEERCLSILTYMELLQGARDKAQHARTLDFLLGRGFEVLSLTENIGHRAAIYVEEYSLSRGLKAGDAIVAATAVENNLCLCTSNVKHFRGISDLKLRVFRP